MTIISVSPGDVLAARQALSRGSSIDALDEHNATPLLHAVRDLRLSCQPQSEIPPVNINTEFKWHFSLVLHGKSFCLVLRPFITTRACLCRKFTLVVIDACCPRAERVRATGDGGVSIEVWREPACEFDTSHLFPKNPRL